MRYLLVLLVSTFLGAGCTDPPTPPNTLTQETLSLSSASALSGPGSFIDLTQATTIAFNFSTIPTFNGIYPVYTNDTFEFQLDFTQSTPACPCTFSYTIGPASGAVTSSTASYISPQIKL